MDDRLREIEARLRALDTALAAVVRRLDRLEGSGEAVAPASGDVDAAAAREAIPSSFGSFDILSLVGRTLIVLGGAFLLRALTESGQVSNGVGIGLGLVYAAAWYVAADRAAEAGRPASSLTHGIAAVIISLPLVWEASTRFAMFDPTTSAVAVALLTGIGLFVAARHRLQSLAGVGTVGAVVTALALGVAMDQMVSFMVLTVGLGLAAWALGETRLAWNWLRWPPAVGATLLAIGLLIRAVAEPPRESIGAAVLTQLFFTAGYLVAFGWRTLGLARPIRPFEAVLTAVVLGLGLGAALAETAGAGASTAFLALGLGSLLASSSVYGLAVAIVRRRQGRGPNYVYFTSLALALLIIGCGALLGGSALAAVAAALALVATTVGSRGTLPTLTLHGAILAATAAVASGLLAAGWVWVGTIGTWPVLPGSAWFALISITICLVIPRPVAWHPPAVLASIGRRLLAVLFVVSSGTALLVVLGPVVAGAPPDAGVLASSKTAVLAVAAVLLALASRWTSLVELGWLVYPVLVLGGLQLAFESLRLSQPSTLFVAMALYGAALVLGPRLKSAVRRA